MKKWIIVFLMFCLLVPECIKGKVVNLYLFYGDGCPHCEKEKKFLNKYLEKESDVKLYTYEVWFDEENASKLEEVQKITKKKSNSIPYLIIGNNVISGFMEDYTEDSIINTINYYKGVNYDDKVGKYLGVVSEEEIVENNTKYENNIIKIPLIGKIDIKNASLALVAIVIGLVDGFNPCAMWILLFLISMLIGMKNKKRMWVLGITFLVTSALIYFLFMISWLNLAILLDKIIYIKLAIGLIAVIFGTYSIIKYLKSLSKHTGCEVVNLNTRKRIINKVKKIVKEDTFILAILGIIILAASVNIIELLCSLGLPVMFTEVLAINSVSGTSKILYTLIYIFFFLLDDLVIFIIAMKTLEIKAISNKYGKYSHLIGGIIMLIIGILMLVKPEWLMFNF